MPPDFFPGVMASPQDEAHLAAEPAKDTMETICRLHVEKTDPSACEA